MPPTLDTMHPSHLPLLLASKVGHPVGDEAEPLDRLRMQKAVFILQMAGPEAWSDAFTFVPWDWGPFSRDLANELLVLQQQGLMETEPVEWRRYPRYKTTPEGEAIAQKVASSLDEKQRAFIQKVRRYVTSRSFSQLLREVYSRFPEFAVNSRFQG